MSIYPVAQDLIPPDWLRDPPIVPRILIFHTAVTHGYAQPHDGLEWHFWIGEHGEITQRRDTAEQADANYHANNFAISCETWGNGDEPWTDQQLDGIVALCQLANTLDGIPLIPVATWNGTGVGYHRQFDEWNVPYHSCPGDLRVSQFGNDILPRLQGDPDVLTPQESAALGNMDVHLAKVVEINQAVLVAMADVVKLLNKIAAKP